MFDAAVGCAGSDVQFDAALELALDACSNPSSDIGVDAEAEVDEVSDVEAEGDTESAADEVADFEAALVMAIGDGGSDGDDAAAAPATGAADVRTPPAEQN